MGRPRIFGNPKRYPFSDEHCKGGNETKGLRRALKDGDITINEVNAMIWGKWKLHERRNKFAKWFRRLTKRRKK
jgi:hypothetical protein